MLDCAAICRPCAVLLTAGDIRLRQSSPHELFGWEILGPGGPEPGPDNGTAATLGSWWRAVSPTEATTRHSVMRPEVLPEEQVPDVRHHRGNLALDKRTAGRPTLWLNPTRTASRNTAGTADAGRPRVPEAAKAAGRESDSGRSVGKAGVGRVPAGTDGLVALAVAGRVWERCGISWTASRIHNSGTIAMVHARARLLDFSFLSISLALPSQPSSVDQA